MTLYGDLDHVKRMLRPHEGTDLGADVDERLARIQVAVSSAIDRQLGRTFGAAVDDTTHRIYAGRSSMLLFPFPARSITSITYADSSELVDSDRYVSDPVSFETGLIWGVRLLSGGAWGGVDAFNRPLIALDVVGDFATTDDDAVIPEDVQYAANRLIQLFFQLESSSATGFVGPEGVIEAPRNPWADPLVKPILGKYASQSRAVVI